MRGTKTFLTVTMLAAFCAPASGQFSGERALEYTRRVVEFGPRPPGSEAIGKLREYLKAELSRLGWETTEDRFVAQTPKGRLTMVNLIVKLPGTSGQAVAVTGHYDTKLIEGIRFVGANDAGSSTGLLLEMARVLSSAKRKHDIYLVWFDGEESFGEWSATDGIRGSRHLAEVWSEDGTINRLIGLINVDMIGDRDLSILREWMSTPSLQRRIWETADRLGHGKHYSELDGSVEDDHVPFLRKGVTAVDLIDFDYGPDNSWWHTEADTMDKLSAQSFQAVGDVLLRVLEEM